LAAFILLFRLVLLAGELDAIVTAAQFEAGARESHHAARVPASHAERRRPAHTHLSGAVYAERFLAWGAQEGFCVDVEKVVLAKPQCDRAGARPLSDAMRDKKFYDRLVDAFSMRDFLPTPALPAGRDEFFAVFDRFGTVSGSRFVDMTVDQLKLYDSQNVQYVEFMTSAYCPNDRGKFVAAVAAASDDAAKLAALEASGLAECVAGKRRGRWWSRSASPATT